MKTRTFFLASAFIAVVALLGGCQKEGVYKPGKRIAQILTLYTSEDEGSTYSESEVWTWDGKQLVEVATYRDSVLLSTITYNYNGDKTLGSACITRGTASTGGKEYYTFAYQGGQLSTISTDGGDKRYNITHTDGRISQIDMEYTVSDGGDAKVLGLLLPREAAEFIAKAKGRAKITTTLEWSSNNISHVDIKGEDWSQSYDFAYDKKRNPYYGSVADGTILFEAMTPPSRNNVLSFHATEFRGDTKTSEYSMHYSYQYDGKYPASSLRSTGNGTCTTYYEYQ